MTPQQIAGRPIPSPAERLAYIQNAINRPVICVKCGSGWFREANFQQYSASCYSAAPGGDLQVISSTVQTIRVCLCGHPVMPNLGIARPGRTVAGSEIDSFVDSLKAAIAYLEAPAKVDESALATDFATRDDHTKLVEEVDRLKAKISQAAARPAEETGESPVSREEFQVLLMELEELKAQVEASAGNHITSTEPLAETPAEEMPAPETPTPRVGGRFVKKGASNE